MQEGTSPHQICEARYGDTTVAIARDAKGETIAVAKYWKAPSGMALSQALMGEIAVLEKTFGQGEPVCLSEGNPRGRRWQSPHYSVSAFATVETSSIGVAFATATTPEAGGCVD